MSRPPTRLIDPATADRAQRLVEFARDNTLNFNLDYCSARPPECAFICQLFDLADRTVLSAAGPTAAEVLATLHRSAVATMQEPEA